MNSVSKGTLESLSQALIKPPETSKLAFVDACNRNMFSRIQNIPGHTTIKIADKIKKIILHGKEIEDKYFAIKERTLQKSTSIVTQDYKKSNHLKAAARTRQRYPHTMVRRKPPRRFLDNIKEVTLDELPSQDLSNLYADTVASEPIYRSKDGEMQILTLLDSTPHNKGNLLTFMPRIAPFSTNRLTFTASSLDLKENAQLSNSVSAHFSYSNHYDLSKCVEETSKKLPQELLNNKKLSVLLDKKTSKFDVSEYKLQSYKKRNKEFYKIKMEEREEADKWDRIKKEMEVDMDDFQTWRFLRKLQEKQSKKSENYDVATKVPLTEIERDKVSRKIRHQFRSLKAKQRESLELTFDFQTKRRLRERFNKINKTISNVDKGLKRIEERALEDYKREKYEGLAHRINILQGLKQQSLKKRGHTETLSRKTMLATGGKTPSDIGRIRRHGMLDAKQNFKYLSVLASLKKNLI